METRAEKAEAAITTLKEEGQTLMDIGLSLEALAEFSERVQSIARRHHISPAGLRERLLQELENLSQGLGLERLVQRRQVELEEQERGLALAGQERESLKAVVESLKQEKISLEASIKETRQKVSQEIARIIPAARDTINRLVEELHCGHNDVLAEVRRLRDEALELGIEVGQYKEMLQSNQWLSDLLALVRGEESIEGKGVRAIILLVLRGVAAWLKQNQADDLRFSTLAITVGNLIGELERWKA